MRIGDVNREPTIDPADRHYEYVTDTSFNMGCRHPEDSAPFRAYGGTMIECTTCGATKFVKEGTTNVR